MFAPVSSSVMICPRVIEPLSSEAGLWRQAKRKPDVGVELSWRLRDMGDVCALCGMTSS